MNYELDFMALHWFDFIYRAMNNVGMELHVCVAENNCRVLTVCSCVTNPCFVSPGTLNNSSITQRTYGTSKNCALANFYM